MAHPSRNEPRKIPTKEPIDLRRAVHSNPPSSPPGLGVYSSIDLVECVRVCVCVRVCRD